MTPLEELQAAHKRLSELRAKATPGAWELAWMLGRADWPVVISDGIGEVINTRPQDATIKGDDANLIVTLHRTMDAQLMLLDDALDKASTTLVPNDGYQMIDRIGLALARAINFEAT